jgi:glucose-1-phosphate cytidylyltransferase
VKAIILCGGQGTRLREETEVRPKPMVEIGGRPILWHILKMYAGHGVTDFVLALGYKGHLIKDYFLNYEARTSDLTVTLGRRATVELHDSHPEEGWRVTLAETGAEALTGARVRRAARYTAGEPFCLTYGDGVADVDLTALLAFHRAHGRLATVTGVRPPGRFGEMRLEGDRVAAFAEKPQVSEGFINGGFMVFQPEVVERYLDDREDLVLEREPLQRLAADGQLAVWRHEGFWQCMDTYREWKLLDDMCRTGSAPWMTWQ